MADEAQRQSRDDMVATFCAVTHLSAEEARRHLELFNWSLEAAVNSALTDGVGEGGAPSPPSPGGAAGDGADGEGEDGRGVQGAFNDGDHAGGSTNDEDDDEDDDEEDEDEAEEEAAEEEAEDKQEADGGTPRNLGTSNGGRAARREARDGARPVPPPPPPLPRGGVGIFRRIAGRLRSALGPWLWPVARYILGSVGFLAQLLIVAPWRLLLGYGPPGSPGRPGGAGRRHRDRETMNALAAAEAARFRRAFEAKHGEDHAPFFIGSLQQAVDAAKTDLRFVLVYVHSDAPAATAAQTAHFSATVLCSDLFTAVLEPHFVLWVADTSTSEGHRLARSMQLREGPGLAVVAYGELAGGEHSELRVLERVPPAQCADVDAVVSALVAVVERSEPMIAAARAERSEREMTRLLREEQEAEFHAALAADQARELAEEEARRREEDERKAREEEARLKAEQEAAEEAAERARLDARAAKAAQLPPQPASGPDVTRAVVRLPDGQRLDRRWHKDATLQQIVDWVEAADPHLYDVALVSHYPRREYGAGDAEMTLEAAGLHPQAMLWVKERDDAEE